MAATDPASSTPVWLRALRFVALFFLFGWYMLGGILHFLNSEFFVQIMPPYFPSFLKLPLVFFSGAFEILFALGLLMPFARRWAAYLLILLTIAVTPANIYMWQNPELFNISQNALTARLGFQLVLIGLLWWVAHIPRVKRRSPALA